VVKVLRSGGRDATAPYTVNLEEERDRRIARALDPVEAGIDPVAALQAEEQAVH